MHAAILQEMTIEFELRSSWTYL